ncbi:class I adenylate-forming enzyme family protein [Streptomyces sp. NPDC056452]|uniref:class I adenylate-forming enzyme family protein n=1 Tax=Streptomyces sp. NPDC056452 TaxID=3345821 RepID=UPI00368F05D3
MAVKTETLLDLVRSSGGTVVVDGRAWRSADIIAGASRSAGGFRSRNVQQGDGVLLVDDSAGIDLLAALLGAWWVGARAVVVPGTDDTARTESIREQTGAGLIVRREGPPARDAVTFADLLAGDPAKDGSEVCVPEDFALDVASSGTTGRPKCVSYTHAALGSNVRAYAARLGLTGRDVLYSPLPLSLAGVLGMVLLPGLVAGATTHIGRLEGAGLARAQTQLRAAKPTLLYGVPYVFDFLARQRAERPGDQLRWAICSSAPLPENTFDRVWDSLGVPPRSSYCLAEAATVTLNTSSDPDNLRRSVGEPLEGVEISVEPTGAEHRAGRLAIGGTSCGAGYRRQGVIEPFAGGRVLTNDLGFLEGGSLTVTGRVDEVIQVAGQNVDLAHVRRVVSRCPGLGDFDVAIDRHENLGPVPILLAEAKTLTVSPREVIAFCRGELRDIEVPREVRVVERIPRTPTGKVRLAGPSAP